MINDDSKDSLSWATPTEIPLQWRDITSLIVFLALTLGCVIPIAFVPNSRATHDASTIRLAFIVIYAASVGTITVTLINFTCIARCRSLLSAATRFAAVAVLAAIVLIMVMLRAYFAGGIVLAAYTVSLFSLWIMTDSFIPRPALTSALLSRSFAWFIQHGPPQLLIVPPVVAVSIAAGFALVCAQYLLNQLSPWKCLSLLVMLCLIWCMSTIIHLVHGLSFVPVHTWFHSTTSIPNLRTILGRCLSRQLGTVMLTSAVVPMLSWCRWHARVSKKGAVLTGAFYDGLLEVLDGRFAHFNRMSLYGALLSNQSLAEGGRRIKATVDQHPLGQHIVNDLAPQALVLLSAASSGALSAALAITFMCLGDGRHAALQAFHAVFWPSMWLGALMATLVMTVVESGAWSLLLCWIADPCRMRVLDPKLDDDLCEIS